MIFAAILGLALIGVVTPHSIGLGACPKVPAINNFQTKEFMGTWYVIEIFGRQTKCMTLTFKQLSDTSLTVTEAMEFYILGKINLDYAHTNTGTLNIEDASNPTKMRVKWPDNIVGSATFSIAETDYESYALIVECQKLWLASRTNAAILSRTPDLPPELITKLKGTVDGLGLDSHDFSTMSHDNCIPEGEADFESLFNETNRINTFGFLEDEKVQTILTEEDLAAAIDFQKPTRK